MSGFIAQANFLLLDNLCLVEICDDVFAIGFFFGIWLTGTIGFQEFLNAAVAGNDGVSAFLNYPIFRLNFF